MIFRMELTYGEIVDLLDIKYIAGSIIVYTLPSRYNANSDLNLMLMSFLPNEVKTNFTIDDIGLRSKFTSNKTIKLRRKMVSNLKQSF